MRDGIRDPNRVILPNGAAFRLTQCEADEIAKQWSKYHRRYFTSMKADYNAVSQSPDHVWTITDKHHPTIKD